MDKLMNMCAGTGACAAVRKRYARPVVEVTDLCEAAAMLAGSEGWTTTDKAGGKGIVEEDKGNPYSDDDFGAKECLGDWE